MQAEYRLISSIAGKCCPVWVLLSFILLLCRLVTSNVGDGVLVFVVTVGDLERRLVVLVESDRTVERSSHARAVAEMVENVEQLALNLHWKLSASGLGFVAEAIVGHECQHRRSSR